jgi:hypothetical protein
MVPTKREQSCLRSALMRPLDLLTRPKNTHFTRRQLTRRPGEHRTFPEFPKTGVAGRCRSLTGYEHAECSDN